MKPPRKRRNRIIEVGSGLSGYRKVIESGVEAVVLEVPPYFFPEMAAAAVDAGLHVYMAKPVAQTIPSA